jgi:hypothetical protein
VKSVTIVSEDKVGLLADISYILAKSKINIDSISVDVVSDKSVIAMLVSNPEKGKKVLEAAGYRVESNTLVIKLNINEIDQLPDKLSKQGVTVQKSTILTKDDKVAIVSLEVDKPKRASKILKKYLITNVSVY